MIEGFGNPSIGDAAIAPKTVDDTLALGAGD
jgi:hypothetical protein